MRRFKSILVHVNVESEQQQALERAARLAACNGAALNVVAAAESPPWLTDRMVPGASERLAGHVKETDEKLTALAAKVTGREIPLTTKTLVGRPWLEIIREVLRNDHDLIVKDIEPEDDADGIFSAHLDMRLLRKCPCPVWLVRPQAHRFGRVAAAVDVFPEASVMTALNKKILELAESLAEAEESELHVVCAWSVYAATALKFKMASSELDQLRITTREAVEVAVKALLSASDGGVAPRVQLPEGEPENVIPDLVEREHEDLVVMGTVARSGLVGALIGNTAEKILRRIGCSLLAIKPDGFVSPVKL